MLMPEASVNKYDLPLAENISRPHRAEHADGIGSARGVAAAG